MEPWPPATVDLASAPRAHPTSERPAARAQLEFGRASSLAAAARTAAGEDRTHDLRIMRPTRYQLRYCRGYQSSRAGLLQRERRSGAQPTFARCHQGPRRLPVEPAGAAPVSGMDPWPPATAALAGAPKAHPTSQRLAARAQLEFGRASSLAAATRTAAGEDRTHDLGIMRPTRYQLRYCRSWCAHLQHIWKATWIFDRSRPRLGSTFVG